MGVPSRDRLVDQAFATAWTLTRHSPEPVAERLLEGVADRVWRRRGDGVRQLEANLRRAAPALSAAEITELSREGLRPYFRYWHEVFRLPSWSPGRLASSVVTSGEERFRAEFDAGRGAILALPHMANWDLAGAWACYTGMPVSTVAERLRPESLFDRFVAYRESLGMEVVALTGQGNPMTRLRAALDRGRLVCLLADRDLTGTGVIVDLLGEPARLPAGPAALARMTGAPLHALTLSYRGPLMHAEFGPRVEPRGGPDGLRAMTQDLADFFSRGIAGDPVDWHMLQPVFAVDLPGSAA